MKSTIFILLVSLSLAQAPQAMPPSPETIESMKSDGTWDNYLSIMDEAHSMGVNSPGPNPLTRLRNLHRDDVDQITLRVPVFLVDFDDHEADRQTHPREVYERLLFELDETSFRSFFLENSYNEVDVIGDVFGWIRMERDYSEYTGDNYGLGGGGEALAVDVVQVMDDEVDFSRYDNDEDGVVEAVMIIHAGLGAHQTGDPGDMWPHAGWFGGLEADGVLFNRYCVNPEPPITHVYKHEMGHALFGLPDLYDYDGSSAGLGDWSLMAHGNVHLDAWCKVRLGFIQPTVVSRNCRSIRVSPVENQPFAYILPIRELTEYFLVENRQRTGFDGRIPGQGLLIYHVDEEMSGFMEQNRNENHPWVGIEQADGRRDLQRNEGEGDNGDPYPGSTNNQTFDQNSNPNSLGYDGEDNLSIINIRAQGNDILCEMLNGIEGQNFVMDSVSVTPERTMAGRDVTIRYRLLNDGNLSSSETTVLLFLSLDTAISEDDRTLGDEQPENPLAPFSEITRVLQRNIPNDLDPGTWYILVVVDPGNQEQEISERDNLGSARILVGSQPNLDLQHFSLLPRHVMPGDSVNLFYRIINSGGDVAGDFNLDFYFSRDAVLTPDDIHLGEVQDEAGLDPDEFVERRLVRTIHDQALAGEYFVLVVVDRFNHIREIDESDNYGCAPLTVPGPNLQVIHATAIPNDLMPGMETEVRVWFTNSGLLDSPSSEVGYALSRNRTLSNDDWILGDLQEIDALQRGDTLITTVPQTIYDEAWTATWHIIVKCDAVSRINELNEDDNIYVIPVSITSLDVTQKGKGSIPVELLLHAPYPNPSNSQVSFRFDLPQFTTAEIQIFDINGLVAANLGNEAYSAGRHKIIWNAGNMPTGVYFVVLKSAGRSQTQKFLLIR